MRYKQLTLEQRYQIKALLTAEYSFSFVAKTLKVSYSTIYRELRRNSGPRSYQPKIAHEKALLRRKYSKKKRRLTPEMKSFIRDKLRASWSPEQIYGYCKKHGINMVCHETIYKHIANNKALGGALYKHLRRGTKRKRRYGSLQRAQNIKNRISIDERPEVVAERSRIGDWEADLVVGKNHKGVLLTIVERRSRYTVAKLLPCKKASVVSNAISELLYPIKEFVHSITFDNGPEFAFHEIVSEALDADAYFAHPYSSWERGTNENTNGLIRQFIPKGTAFDKLSDGYVKKVIRQLNRRPRKVLGFRLPVAAFAERPIV